MTLKLSNTILYQRKQLIQYPLKQIQETHGNSILIFTKIKI